MKKRAGVLMLMASSGAFAAQQDSATPTREAMVTYWTSGYVGAELAGTGCAAPALSDLPTLSRSEHAANKAIRNWQDCHRRLMGALAPEAAGKIIPAKLQATMTPDERAAALRHVAAVNGKIANVLQADAAKTIAAQQAWRTAAKRPHGAADLIDVARDRLAQQSPDDVRHNEVTRRP